MTKNQPRRVRDERGSGPITAILIIAVLALLLGAGFTALGAAAGDENATALHAADAAALGGAQGVVDDLPDLLTPGFANVAGIAGLIGGGSCLQVGVVDATRLAAANGARLDSYCYNVFRDEVSVSVTLNQTNVSGPPATAKAEAATTFEASSCRLDPGFSVPTASPSPTPTPTEDDDDAPPPPPPPPPAPPSPVLTWVDCGTGRLPVTFYPSTALFRFGDLTSAFDDLKPRLTA